MHNDVPLEYDEGHGHPKEQNAANIVTESGMTTDVRLEHPVKGSYRITESGRTTDVRLVHIVKAE